jgi:hypothetical protein
MAGQADPGNDQAVVLGNHLETNPVLACREWLAYDDFLPLDTLSMAQKRRLVDVVQRCLQTFFHAVVVPPIEEVHRLLGRFIEFRVVGIESGDCGT